MSRLESFKDNIFLVDNSNFEDSALKLFRFQAKYNKIYRNYINMINVDPDTVQHLGDIPFLPVELFKSNEIKTGKWKYETIFESSGTTGIKTSKHFIQDLDFYRSIATAGFKHFYGELDDYVFLALLPSYLERKNSSLVVMMEHFISNSMYSESGFYLDNPRDLINCIESLGKDRKVLLIGVTFALLDLAERENLDLKGVILMETGGMKGRREEMIREEIHQVLEQQFKVKNVHSEYGMTELLSQAYASSKGHFRCPPWMKIMIRDMYDPKRVQINGSGGINVIDLANIHSCAFIETQDIGVNVKNKGFEVLGRVDNSDVRGCNLLVI